MDFGKKVDVVASDAARQEIGRLSDFLLKHYQGAIVQYMVDHEQETTYGISPVDVVISLLTPDTEPGVMVTVSNVRQVDHNA